MRLRNPIKALLNAVSKPRSEKAECPPQETPGGFRQEEGPEAEDE